MNPPHRASDLVARVDQHKATLATYADLLAHFRRGLIEGGFSEREAFCLCKDEALRIQLEADDGDDLF